MGQGNAAENRQESSRHGRIESVLSRIRPVLQTEGVRVEILDVGDSGASVAVTGLRPTCASGPLTMHTGLVELLREEIPDFGELRLVLDAGNRDRHARTRLSGRQAEAALLPRPPQRPVLIGDSERMRAVL